MKTNIENLKNADPEAFKSLVAEYQDKVLNTCFRFVHNREDAEDVAQEVFVEIYRSISHFREESRLSTWIYRIAVTRSLDFIRKKKRKKRTGHLFSISENKEQETIIPLSQNGDPEKQLEDKRRDEILKDAVDSLPENQQIAVSLNKYEGFSYNEVADMMGTSLSSVESLIHRGMNNLRKKLEKYYKQFYD